MNSGAKKASSGAHPEPEAHAAAVSANTPHVPVVLLPAHSKQEHQQTRERSRVGENRLRERLEDILAGPPMVRVIAGFLFLTVAIAGTFVGLRDAWEKLHAPSLDYTEPNVPELTGAFDEEVQACKHKQDCIAAELAKLPQRVHSKEGEYAAAERLFADQVIGEVVRSSPEAMELLHKVYGADQGFLGTGLSKPAAQGSFAAARFPEYLVPNYRDSHEGVLVWNLTKLQYWQANLYDTLRSVRPVNTTGWSADQLSVMRQMIDKEAVWNADTPAVIRFALIGKRKYSGCLGRKEAHEVFASHLGFLRANSLTLAQAARMSGYPAPSGDAEMYVFVFLPHHEGELVTPTWKSMVSNISAEMARQSPCAVGSVTE